MVGQLVRHDVVKVLAWLTGKPDEESVKASRSVDKLGVEELVGEWDSAYSPPLDGSFLDQAANDQMSGWMSTLATTWYLLQQTLDQCVTKSECSSGKAVEDCGVDLRTVLLAVPTAQGYDVQLCHEVSSDNNWQPLVVCDVLEQDVISRNGWLTHLHLCNKNPPGLLVELLVLPVRIEVGELRCQPVVLPQPDRVECR